MVTQNYIVNLKVGGGISPIVKLSQGDVGRELVFLLYDGAVRFTPPSGATVKIKGTKPSGLGFDVSCTLTGSVARVNTILAITQESGNIPAELEITSGNNVIGTANFVIYSEPSPHPAGTTDGTTEEARTVLAQCEAYAELAQEAAEAASGDYTEIRSDVDDLEDRVEALEAGGGGSGLTDAVKTALMNLANHVAWDDDDPTGQSYITALYNALYPPAPPASLTSITAVYTQSGTVYDTDSLNDLKSDLVVTAHYSDSTTGVVTGYTLSGTLAAGTSTITVTYSGKTTTFTVTVTSDTGLYPLENGSHTFTENNRVLTVTNGNHFVYEWSGATTQAVSGAYLNLSTVSDNDTSATAASNITLSDVLFTIPANAQVVFAIKNISLSNVGGTSSNKYAFNMRNGGTSLDFASGDKGVNDTADIIIEKTVEADTPVTCIYLYASRQFSRFEADISLTVNNVRWI